MGSTPSKIRADRVTPLRYPGGKGKFTSFIRAVINANGLDELYAEPYAGGAGIAMNLLLSGDVTAIAINDLSTPVYCFWKALLQDTESLCRLIADVPLTVESWDKQKRIFAAGDGADYLSLGFATFFLNRTNRSGILNGGIIGGRDQTGTWKIGARYKTADLLARIEAISQRSARISLTNQDAIAFLAEGREEWPSGTLVYLDPPYYVKGRDLYYHFYMHSDHEAVADAVAELGTMKWVVSYDNVRQVRDLYAGYNRAIYNIGYSARSARKGSEVTCSPFSPPLISRVRGGHGALAGRVAQPAWQHRRA